MMGLTGDGVEFNYAETDEIQILEMPYDGEDVSMLIILPRDNDLINVEKAIAQKSYPNGKQCYISKELMFLCPNSNVRQNISWLGL